VDSVSDLLHRFSERLQDNANVRCVYGEAITAAGRTVVPVARIGYGFGFGVGARSHVERNTLEEKEPRENESGGGGGGIGVYPVGALEITTDGTHFITYPNLRAIGTTFVVGFLAGFVFGRKFLQR
jgi:uncharacterized spore protein YtfJ